MDAIDTIRRFNEQQRASMSAECTEHRAILELADAITRIDKEMDDLRFRAEWMQEIEGRVKALEHPEVKVHDVEKYNQEPTKGEALEDHVEGLINTYLEGNDGIDESIGDLARKIIAAVRGQS